MWPAASGGGVEAVVKKETIASAVKKETKANEEAKAVVVSSVGSLQQQVPESAEFFEKDGRKIRVGHCALFQAGNAPPFIGLIRWIRTNEEEYPKLRVSWLYRSSDLKLNKGIQLNAAPNEIFYSFHQDVISAASLLHPCKVAFLPKGVELPVGTSSFVCWRVYDIDNKCLWWLTDQDYINERQEEVDRLLDRTRQEMNAAVQSGGRSPKRLNGPSSAQQLKPASDSAQNCASSFPAQSKGKKRDRSDQGVEPTRRDRVKVEDGDSVNFKFDNMKAEIAKITEKGGLANVEAVEKLANFMQLDRTERKIDLASRVMLADIIAATEKEDCLERFVQLRGLPVLDDWLQEVYKGKSGDGTSPKENDRVGEEQFLLALLRALAKLPINLSALKSCNIGKSVNHLRNHKNLEIQKKARALVETWKKRVDAEMKTNDGKMVGSVQAVTWPAKGGFSEVPSQGNKRSEPNPKSQASHIPALKTPSAKPGTADATVKLSSVGSGSAKLQPTLPAAPPTSLKDSLGKSAGANGGSELPLATVKEEKSSSSSQSQNNSQSCSSDHVKIGGLSWKEDARSSTAGSISAKTSSGSSCHRRSSNGIVGSAVQKEANMGRSGSVERTATLEKTSQSGMASEKAGDLPLSDHGNSHRLIVRFPNPGRSPARSASGGSLEDPSATGSRASSPVLGDKHELNDHKVKGKGDTSGCKLPSDVNNESWHSNDCKGAVGSEEGHRSPSAIIDDEHSRTADEVGKATCASKVACSSSGNEKGIFSSESGPRNSYSSINALIESCVKYSEASPTLQVGDDTGMNLLASVAAGEMSKSEQVSPSASPRSSAIEECGDNVGKSVSPSDVGIARGHVSCDEVENVPAEKHERSEHHLAVTDDSQEKVGNLPSLTKLPAQDDKGGAVSVPSPLSSLDHHKDAESCVKAEDREKMPAHKNVCPSAPGVVKCEHDEKLNAGVESNNHTDSKSNVCSKSGNEDESACIVRQIVEEARTSTCSSLGDQCNATISNNKVEKVEFEESSISAANGKKDQDTITLTDQKQDTKASDHSEVVDRCGGDIIVRSISNATPCPADAVVMSKRTESLTLSNTVANEDGKDQPSLTPVGITKRIGSAVASLCAKNEVDENKELKDCSSESSSHVKLHVTQETEQCANGSGSKKSGDDAGGKELVSSDEGSSLAGKADSNTGVKLDFDLNEGIPGDDIQQSEPATPAAVICSSSVHLPGLSPFVSPIASGLPAQITVAAPAKGPFVPPENLLRVKCETGWKGSAATSAFRPAEPRKILEMSLSTSEIPASDSGSKSSRPALDIDLNVADERILEEELSQSSAQTTESGTTRNLDAPPRATGFELDLNRADESAENAQLTSTRFEVPLLPVRPLPGNFRTVDANSSRDFDLNNGPGLDEAGTEPAPRSQVPKNANNVPLLPTIAGVRMNNAEIGNMSSWFPPGNSYPAVALPSFLHDRGEQPYSIITAPGSQRIMGSVTGGSPFPSENYWGPVLSSSPAMAFSPAAYHQYAGFPFGSSFPLPSPAFSVGSAPYADAAPAGASCFPAIPSQFVGSAGAVPSHFTRPYVINLPEGSSSSGYDSSRKRARQGLDLNSGPGSGDVEGKEERIPSSSRENLVTPSLAFVEEQARIYHVPGLGIKRKEPDGGWDAERSGYKQLSWQ